MIKKLLPQHGIDTISFDTELFPIKEAVVAALGRSDLECLTTSSLEQTNHHKSLQRSSWHGLFYSNFDHIIRSVYEALVQHIRFRHNIPAGGLVYQRTPTFRVHTPGSKAVGEWHTDGAYGHTADEVIFWLPLTKAFGTNTLWIEQEGFRFPIDAEYGDIVVFDGVRIPHGNMTNTTDSTRVSFDFRLALLKDFHPSGKNSISAGRSLSIGDYFSTT